MANSSSSADNSNWRVLWADGKCPYCTRTLKGAQGVRVHISNAHPQQSQEIKISNREKRSTRKTTVTSANTFTLTPAPSRQESVSQNVTTIEDDVLDNSSTLPSVQPWVDIFTDLLSRPDNEDITTVFSDQVERCARFLSESIQHVKGPKHPNSRYYEARRAGRLRRQHGRFQNSSNPSRRDRRRRDAAREKYQYDLVQYQYYNTRRQAARNVLNSGKKTSCQLPVNEVETHFKSLLETPNENVREQYEQPAVCTEDSDTISEIEVRDALKGMAVDTSPGPDKVLLRVVKLLKCEKLISLIATIMYRRTLVPTTFQLGRTILLPKDGDPGVLKNWRPITIFSVLRRIIERVLDRRLRSKAEPHTSQRGFVSVPGTHLNSSIVNGVMRSARRKKKSCVLVFLDITKAFDNIGHAHVRRTLEALPLPDKLRDLVCKMCTDNLTNVCVGPNTTRQLHVSRGVPQGAPLSPALFNLCVDFVLRELADGSVAQEYGYSLVDDLQPLTVLAFADDIVIIAKDQESARRLVEITTRSLETIGLHINESKSQAVVFSDGIPTHLPSGLPLFTGNTIPTLRVGDSIRYLGVDFEHEIVLDEAKTLRQLKDSLDRLTNSCLLHPDQKLNILNTYIWPALVYPLQTAPIHKIRKGFLSDVDALLRGAVKQFCNLPMDTPNAMLYASPSLRGLGVIRASWEAFLQHVNIVRRLELTEDPYLSECRDLHSEESVCLQKLQLNQTHTENSNTYDNLSQTSDRLPVRKLRSILRDREFAHWCSLPSKGLGVGMFSETPACNKWVRVRSGLSVSEWTNALKMSSNGCNLRSNPRTASDTFHCRHCNEFESLGHVLGKCHRGELLRNRRHHRVCDAIAEELRQLGCTVLREDHQLTDNQGSRFSDLVVIDPRDNITKGFILDPTIRFERSCDQANEVDAEKRAIYEPTLPAYRDRFPEVTEWNVFGLLFGARGSIPRPTAEVLTTILHLPKRLLSELSLSILKDSLGLLHHHLYSRDQA